jgi:Trypsin-like peptidase domain
MEQRLHLSFLESNQGAFVLKRLPILGVLLISFSTSAAPDLSADLGFYSPADSKVPAAIRPASKSVFRLVTLGQIVKDKFFIADVTNGGGQRYIETFRTLNTVGPFDRAIVISQLNFCLQKLPVEKQKTCLVNFNTTLGSGFLLNDGRTLWTAMHTVGTSLFYFEQLTHVNEDQQLEQKGPLFVYVFDQNDRLLVDPTTDGVNVDLIPERIGSAPRVPVTERNDFMRIRLSKNIGSPLKLANATIPIGSLTYPVGYPACTGCERSNKLELQPEARAQFLDRSPKPNAYGGLVVTIGKIVQVSGLSDFLGLDIFNAIDKERILWTTADGVQGLSGGPVLNQNGEVVAILTTALAKVINGRLQVATAAVIPPDFRPH